MTRARTGAQGIRVDALARAATVEAVQLETQEAPQVEIEEQQKRADVERLALEKARSANKPNFRPLETHDLTIR